jgi:hypothetical protein
MSKPSIGMRFDELGVYYTSTLLRVQRILREKLKF